MAKILEIQEMTKTFPGVTALNKVTFDIQSGDIHAVVGENGAGKSTLMKILGGLYLPTSGSFKLRGEPVVFSSVHDAIEHGIVLIAQELNIAMDLTVYENIFIGGELNHHGIVDRGAMRKRAKELLASLGSDLDVETLGRRLSVAQMQLVEISRALRFDPQILIMDEPTASLSEKETANMFHVMQSLKERGITILFISHRLPEVVEIADVVTILRDGQYVGTLPKEEICEERMVSMMVGRELTDYYRHEENNNLSENYNLIVYGMDDGSRVHDVSFGTKAGEIVVFAGLVGAGRTELFNLFFGLKPKQGGTVWLDGKEVKIGGPLDALEAGMSYVPEDRKVQGLFLDLAIEKNIVMNVMKENRHSSGGFLKLHALKKTALEAVEARQIKTPDVDRAVVNLSGGNQQKVLLARWLESNPRILVLDEPTKGIDVGAKSEIYEMMGELAMKGVTCIMSSSDLPEVIGVAQRILVMHEGRIVTELVDKKDFNQELIMSYATGVKEPDYKFQDKRGGQTE